MLSARRLVAWLVLWSIPHFVSSSLPPIEIRAYKFFDSVTGQEFVAKGIDYYPRPNHGDLNHNSLDFFTSQYSHIWKRDIAELQALGVNAIRLYAVDPDQNHDEFMCALDEAGIYVIVALAHEETAVTRDEAPACYPPALKERGQRVIEAFGQYSNTLAFSAGNEVNHYTPLDHPEWNAPCQKKFVRDMRAFVASCDSIRNIPVGLVSADSDRDVLAQYYNCHEAKDDPFDTAEWYGLNSYVYCDGSITDYAQAGGLQKLQESFQRLDYSIPVFLTEFGCLSDSFSRVGRYEAQRPFHQAAWLLTESALRDQFSGGFAFEYSMEYELAHDQSAYPFTKFGHQNYGVGYLSPADCDDIEIPCRYNPTPAYNSLQEAYSTSPVTISSDQFVVPPSRAQSNACPEGFARMNSFVWEADQHPFDACPAVAQTHQCVAAPLIPTIEQVKAIPVRHHTITILVVAVVAAALGTIIYEVCFRRRTPMEMYWLKYQAATEQEVSSDESAGLLSLRSYRGGDYLAIGGSSSSDASTDEIQALAIGEEEDDVPREVRV